MQQCCIIMASLSINNTVMAVIAVAIGLVLIGSLLAPIASDVMLQLVDVNSEEGKTWADLVGITVIMSILGLVIVAVNSFTKR